MFEYFPGNYVWNLGVVAALNSGGYIDEVDRACRPIREAATRGEDAGTEEFLASWTAVVDDLVEAAGRDRAVGRTRSAGHAYARAANYLIHAERMQSPQTPDRNAIYRRVLELMQQSFDLVDPNTVRVSIPFRDTTLPAYFTRPDVAGPVPCMIVWNGLDSTKEHMYLSGFAYELAERGSPPSWSTAPAAARHCACKDSPPRSRPRNGRPPVSTTSRPSTASTPHASGWSAGRWAAITPPCGGLREAAGAVCGMGRQPRLGQGAASPNRTRRRTARAALLEPRDVGLG